MKIDERFILEASASRLWSEIRDPALLVRCIPGMDLLGQQDNEYKGRIRLRLGPTVAVFDGAAIFTTDEESMTGAIQAAGIDAKGSTRARASLRFEVGPDPGGSILVLRGKVETAGPLSTFAEAGGVFVVRGILDEMVGCLNEAAVAPSNPGSRIPEDRELSVGGTLIAAVRAFFRRLLNLGPKPRASHEGGAWKEPKP